jgi:hypothetical protein
MIFGRSHLGNPASDAAQFLRRLAFILLLIITPAAQLVSHGLIYILFPIGVAILVIACVLVGGENAPRRMLAALIRNPLGISILFLAFWSGLSLLWTVFPSDAAPRLGRTLMTAGLAFVAVLSLPQRAKISNIYLLPIGIALTAAVTLPLVLIGPDFFREGYAPDSILAHRCVVSLVLLVWPAIGALALREHFIKAALLALLVAAASLGAFLPIALAALMLGALTYAAAMSHPERVGKIMAVIFVVVFLGAPIFAALYYLVTNLAHLPASGPELVFAQLAVHEWPRLITGHGLDMVERGIEVGLLPQATPRSIIFMLWYELGVIGVGAFVAVLVFTMRATALLPHHAAPAYLATIVAGIVIALFGAETAQLWWLTLNSIAAIAVALLVKAHPRAKHPRAPAADEHHEFDDEYVAYESYEPYRQHHDPDF